MATTIKSLDSEVRMPEGRIPSLDGWRGIAILLVVFEHLQWSKLGHPLARWTNTGQHGVTIFFVLSGFLITSKLMEDRHALKKFYVRRFFRLMPAAWLCLGVTLLLHRFAGARMYPREELLGCLFFYRNYVPQGIITQHFWSLSLEEQFYLVWPLLLLVSGPRKARWMAPLGALAVALWRAFHWNWYNRYPFDFRTEVRADALLIGCALALFLSEPGVRAFAVRWSPRLKWPALAVFIYCSVMFTFLPPFMENLSIAILIAATVLRPEAASARFLARGPLVWLGRISYSLYLWQGLLALKEWSWFGSFFVLVLAVGSYYYVEQPFINFGSRLLRRSANTLAVSKPA